MDTVSIKLQMQADAAYRRGDIVEAIQLTKTAMKAAKSDSAKKVLQERIEAWAAEIIDKLDD